MVEIRTSIGQRRWETTHARLSLRDMLHGHLAETSVYEARKWIRAQGYHLRTQAGYAAIRLEKNSYTIIEVSTDVVEWQGGNCTSDCVCYAAILLYRRLKREGVL